jgi:single-strand DNA-binding protein|tara:strand:+ start:11396 stop:11773 length:378 start_codon:yes stop_codon:yes gene_type:complete
MINKVMLIGRLGADPELKKTKNGDSFANLSLATNKKIKDNEKTTWHKIVVFDPRIADTMGKYAKKGTQLYIQGEIETRSYKDANDNQRYVTEIIVPRYSGVIKMLSGKGESTSSSDSGSDFDDQF